MNNDPDALVPVLKKAMDRGGRPAQGPTAHIGHPAPAAYARQRDCASFIGIIASSSIMPTL